MGDDIAWSVGMGVRNMQSLVRLRTAEEQRALMDQEPKARSRHIETFRGMPIQVSEFAIPDKVTILPSGTALMDERFYQDLMKNVADMAVIPAAPTEPETTPEIDHAAEAEKEEMQSTELWGAF